MIGRRQEHGSINGGLQGKVLTTVKDYDCTPLFMSDELYHLSHHDKEKHYFSDYKWNFLFIYNIKTNPRCKCDK